MSLFSTRRQIGGFEARSAGILRVNPHEAGSLEIEAVNEGLDEADRVVRPHVIANRFRQKQQLGVVCSRKMRHGKFTINRYLQETTRNFQAEEPHGTF